MLIIYYLLSLILLASFWPSNTIAKSNNHFIQISEIQTKQQSEINLKGEGQPNKQKNIANESPSTLPLTPTNGLQKNSQNEGNYRAKEGTEFCILFGYRLKITDFLMILFTIALAFFSGLLAFVTYWQYQLSKKTRRAFVFLKRMDFEPIMLRRGLQGNQEGQMWLFSPCWQNSGDTPTKNLTISINNAVFDYEIHKEFDFHYDNIKDIPTVIGPKAEIIFGAFAKPFYTSIEPLQGSQISNLYIWGEAKYNDVFSKKIHCTRFCIKMLFLTQQAFGGYDIPTFIYYDKYNCADEDCDKQS